MNWIVGVGLVAVAVGLLAGLAYWVIVITEGAFFGRRFVVWLYDRGAHEYDEIKAYHIGDEALFLGQPLERALTHVPHPLVLDVATGTARLPLALLRRLNFDGTIVGLDLSWEMLCRARPKTAGYGERLTLVWKDATSLPFTSGAFNAVTCMEALEFLPNARATLQEMVRVLQPGGICLVTNRIGRDAVFFFSRYHNRDQFEEVLSSLGLEDVKTQRWQEDYDLVWARKRGHSQVSRRARRLADVLCCPRCRVPLSAGADDTFECPRCQRGYPLRNNIVMLEGADA